jgi:predicted enzyme related to lactoylglutathione lyase
MSIPMLLCRILNDQRVHHHPDADGLIRFLSGVFDGVDHPDARTVDDDGLLQHTELQIGTARSCLANANPGGLSSRRCCQVYVDGVDATLARAEAGGAEVVTRPTAFFGDVFALHRPIGQSVVGVQHDHDGRPG